MATKTTASAKTTVKRVTAVKPATKKATKKTAVVTPQVPVLTSAARKKGVLLALLSIPAGIIVWDILWSGGFMASIVAFGIAWLAVKLFEMAAKMQPDFKAAKALIAIIFAGVILSFVSGMVMDINSFYAEEAKITGMQTLMTPDFWNVAITNLTQNGAMWASYGKDIAIAVVFALLGSWGIISQLIVARNANVAAEAK